MPPPAAVAAALRDAAALLRHGRAAEAVAAYRRIVKAHPENPEAHHNLGVALRAEGHGEEAVAAYRRAIELRPGYAAAHHNLGQALSAAGRPMEALKHHFQAYRLARDRADFAQALATGLRSVRLKSASPAVVEGVVSLFAQTDIDRQDLMGVTASLILARAALQAPLAVAGQPWQAAAAKLTAWWNGAEARALAADPLFHGLLRETVLSEERLETLAAALRRLFLERVARGQPLEAATGDYAVAASLACQGFATNYAASESAAEAKAVEQLARRLAREALAIDSEAAAELLMTLAMYRPLGALSGAAEAARRARRAIADLDEVVKRQIDEPAEERKLADAMQSLTEVADATSAAVRRQYEENPYPRWRSITRRPARPLAEVLTGLFPALDPAVIPPPRHRILVAGCGTGRHALNVAFRYADSDILAVDLSRASLAYGMRRAHELGVDNIRFRQADILGLDAIGERFDLIEASGVLHHMADPLKGWAILVDLLKPGGFIKIGLYSTLARQGIAAARRFVAARGFPATADGVRAARGAVRALAPDDPVRKVADELDFASISGCRDLLFHVQETGFTLPQIAAAIEALKLNFLGFEVVDEGARLAYAKLFPDDRRRVDLDRWRQIEEQRPGTFRTMYQFWCRRP
ncbi:MAG: methyltransferase domain-containing protein [Rhodospirillales bacterium]